MSAKEMLLEQANARLEHHLDLCRSALKLVLGCETYHNERGHAFLAVPARSLNDLGAQIQFVLDATLIGSVSDSTPEHGRERAGALSVEKHTLNSSPVLADEREKGTHRRRRLWIVLKCFKT